MNTGNLKVTAAAARSIFQRVSVLLMVAIASLSVVAMLMIYALNTAPRPFPIGSDLLISEGMTVREIGDLLERSSVIRSSIFFQFLIKSSYTDLVIQAGSYRFNEPQTTRAVIDALESGLSRSPAVTLTFPEGFSVYDIEEYTKDLFGPLEIDALVVHEGYLFPDTYFVSDQDTIDDLVIRMRQEFDRKIEPYRTQIRASGFTEHQVVILASILEREANDRESMKKVSGILQNRLREGLPLQVDATFEYILGKTSSELTLDDLSIDSPYNTYTNLGLPPTPIANPGILAIEAVLNPLASDLYYYLTGDDGVFYYARTFEEHKRNKDRYLR
jgi:UPF0755 protein